MIRFRFLLPVAAGAAFLLTSCSPVWTVTPVAKETEESLQEEFQGAWKMGEGVFHIAFDEENAGHFAWIEWKENDFVMSRGQFNALGSADDEEMGFISIRVDDEEE
ncbi:MAG: hypothetical protein P1U86_19375, partial [Verrucomicrobiales bacterium]|nr:hypothetical protein [Verrucomicrobiales bacterium]